MSLILTINTPDNTSLTAKWDDYEQVKQFEFYQTQNFSFISDQIAAAGPTSLSDEMFRNFLKSKIEAKFARFVKRFDNIGDVSTIVCVGSGTSILELFLSQYYRNAVFYLVDKSEFNLTPLSRLYTEGDTQHTVFQNSWEVLKDGIVTSGLDPNRFVMLDPTDQWPNQIDIIHSEWSWAWHYSYTPYEKQALAKLRFGGKLGLSVLTIPDEANPFIERISTGLNNYPSITEISIKSTPRTKHQYPMHDMQTGGFFTWSRTTKHVRRFKSFNQLLEEAAAKNLLARA